MTLLVTTPFPLFLGVEFRHLSLRKNIRGCPVPLQILNPPRALDACATILPTEGLLSAWLLPLQEMTPSSETAPPTGHLSWLEPDPLAVSFGLGCSLAEWPWLSYFTSPSPSALVCKIGQPLASQH